MVKREADKCSSVCVWKGQLLRWVGLTRFTNVIPESCESKKVDKEKLQAIELEVVKMDRR